MSAAQRSTENAESKLRAQPWWTVEQSGYEKEIRKLEYYWKTMRDEANKILKQNKDRFPLEDEGLLDTGDWRQLTLDQRGQQNKKNCQLVPKTCEIISQFKQATGNIRGQIKFSIMTPGTHVWPHTGPTNCRLRAHLGLSIPKGVEIRVGSETRSWENGKVLIFDDSFDHEVWHRGTESRLILIIDFWHPDLPLWERQSLAPI
uniref:Aspartyl/asparaginy/proline hydroxylase domain-containing protein n=2 Tax=Clytia hemisphaerica TaxID=252671 RepID=A0A7M6DQ88_9CNID|eukprot:TCONS_00036704-protein